MGLPEDVAELGPDSPFLALARCLRELVFVWKPSGEMLWVNPAFERETGMTVEDFGFRNADNPFIHPDDLPLVLEQMAAFLASSDQCSSPIKNRFFDAWGRVRALTSVTSKVVWASEPALLFVTAEEPPVAGEGHDAGEVQRRLMDAIGDGVVELSSEGTILFSNRMFQSFVSLRPVQLTRRRLTELFAPESGPLVDEAIRAVNEQGRDARFEGKLTDESRVLDVQLNRIELANRHTTALAIARDITALRQAEQAVRSSEERFHQLFDGAADAFFILDASFRFVDVNRAACVSLGLAKQDLIGRMLVDIEVDTHALDLASINLQFKRRGAATREGMHRRSDGVIFPVEVSITPFERDATRYYFAVARDVSERRRAEAERARLEDALRHSQRLESIGRLAGGVAHDFNNMLTAIGGNVALVLAELNPHDPSRELLLDVERATASAAKVTRQLLAFSRKQLIEPKVLDLNETILHWQNMLQRLLGEDTALQIELSARLCSIKIDPGQLEQILVNLCVNARDAMPSGGTLTIATSVVAARDVAVTGDSDLGTGDLVCLSISDQGLGMSDEVKSHLFEPFFTTKEPGKGTGLGLAMVYGAVQQNGGAIDIDSKPGRGTTVRLYLRSAERTVKSLPAGRGLDLARGTESLVLVEDEESVRHLAQRVLARLGYSVRAFSNGESALLEIELGEKHPDTRMPIDLLITDVVMPGMNGRVLADRVRALRPEIEVLFTSGYAEDVVGQHGVLEEGIELLSKPYTVGELAQRVRSLLDKQRVRCVCKDG